MGNATESNAAPCEHEAACGSGERPAGGAKAVGSARSESIGAAGYGIAEAKLQKSCVGACFFVCMLPLFLPDGAATRGG